MIYVKNGGLNSGSLKCYKQSFEYMFVFSKGTPKTINLIKDRKNKVAWDNVGKPHRQKDGSQKIQYTNVGEYGIRTNLWEYNIGWGHSSKDALAFKHPAIFPEQLAIDHIRSWSNEGDIVLDPFMGSGTTPIAAYKLNRKAIGIEMNDEYYALSKQRITNVVAQGKLF